MTDKKPCPWCYTRCPPKYPIELCKLADCNAYRCPNRDPDPAAAKLAKIAALIGECVERNQQGYDEADEHLTIGHVWHILNEEKP